MMQPATPINQPVLLLYNINPAWPPEDIAASRLIAAAFRKSLEGEGQPVAEACLEDQDLRRLLLPYSPEEDIVVNWCEELPGIPHSYDLVARILEDLGYVFTGADSSTLAFSQDKRKVKRRLDSRRIPTPKWQVLSAKTGETWTTFPAIAKPALEHCSYGISREAVV